MLRRLPIAIRDFVEGWKSARRKYKSQIDAFMNSGHGEGYCFKCDSGSCITVGESPSGILYMECVRCGTIYDYDVSDNDSEEEEEYRRLFACSDILSRGEG